MYCVDSENIMTRQRKYQLKQVAEGKCALCGKDALPSKHVDAKSAYGAYCATHAEMVRVRNLERYYAAKAKITLAI